MLRVAGRGILLFAGYLSVILAVVIAGFLGSAVGIWASVLWGLLVVGAVVIYARRKSRPPQVDA